MKSRRFIFGVMGLSALITVDSAMADFGGRFDGPVAVSSKTRAEVRAELEQARAAGFSFRQGDRDEISAWSRSNMGAMGAHGVAGARLSGRTREEVRAEAIEYLKNYKYKPEYR